VPTADPEAAALVSVLSTLENLDPDAQQRLVTLLASRYLSGIKPVGQLNALRGRTLRRGGRPYSPTTHLIIESLEAESPATPTAVAQRTGIDRNTVKVTMNRLAKSGVLVKDAPGLYRPANSHRTEIATGLG
jgi:hypothetical protein